MRFDIVLNNLSGLAWTTKKIAMTSDGTPWRPLVHGLDIAQAIRCVLDAPRDVVHNEIFNVGSTEQNYRVREIAEIVGDEFPGCEVTLRRRRRRTTAATGCRSTRSPTSCRASRASGTPQRAPQQLHEVFGSIDLDEATFTGRGHTRLLQLEHLIATSQLDADSSGAHAMIITPTAHRGRRRSSTSSCAPTTAASSPAPSASTSSSPPAWRPLVEQCNMSFNHQAGTLRGMHYQLAPHPEAKLVRCIRGAIVDIIVDMRPDSPTYLQHVAVELTADNRRALYVPPYFAHGYQTLVDDTEVHLPGQRLLRRPTPSAACATTTRPWASTGRCR